jgi:hypothetical protein
MSVSPRQNFLKPPPVPEMPTVTLTVDRFLSDLLEVFGDDGASVMCGKNGLGANEPSILTSRSCASA